MVISEFSWNIINAVNIIVSFKLIKLKYYFSDQTAGYGTSSKYDIAAWPRCSLIRRNSLHY